MPKFFHHSEKQRSTSTPETLLKQILPLMLLLACSLIPAACTKTPQQPMVVWITVLGTDNMPAEDAQVYSSVGYIKKISNGWELEIPPMRLPQDKKVTIYATQKALYLKGKQEIKITDDKPISVSVQMQRDTSAHVTGTVADMDKKPIAGAKVGILGVTGTANTDAEGHFTLPAKAAEGEEVRLRISKRGYITRDQYHPAGNTPAYVILQRE